MRFALSHIHIEPHPHSRTCTGILIFHLTFDSIQNIEPKLICLRALLILLMFSASCTSLAFSLFLLSHSQQLLCLQVPNSWWCLLQLGYPCSKLYCSCVFCSSCVLRVRCRYNDIQNLRFRRNACHLFGWCWNARDMPDAHDDKH